MTFGRGRWPLRGGRILLLAAVVAGAAAAYLGLSRSHAAAPGARTHVSAAVVSRTRHSAEIVTDRREMARFHAALERGVARARELGGRVQAAIWVDGWTGPITAGDDLDKPMRMWSMAKPIEAVAGLQLAARDRVRVTPGFSVAMERALRRSENCAARRMVLEVQELTGGLSGARTAFGAILRVAGGHPIVAYQTEEGRDQSVQCEAFVERERSGLVDLDGKAVLFGTSRWTVEDAARFAHALAGERYAAAGAAVLLTMAKPKQLSQERGAVFTAELRWGAGVGFLGYQVAYKAGWGGTRQRAFLAGQFAIVDVKGRHVAVAAMFHPAAQPRIDDPGETLAPQALEEIFTALAGAFPRLHSARH